MTFFDLKNLILIPAFIAWIRIPFPQKRWILLFGLTVVASILVEVLAISGIEFSSHNLLIYNIYLITEHLLLSAIFVSIPYHFRFQKALAFVSSGLVIAMMIQFAVEDDFYGNFNMKALIIGGFFLAAQSMASLYQLASREDRFWKTAPFWILSSILVYFLCSTPMHGLMRTVDEVLQLEIYGYHDIWFLVRYSLIITGFVLLKKTLKK